MNIGYLYLTIAISAEVIGSTLLKYTVNFTKPIPSIGCFTLFALAIFMLSKTINYIPLYIAYSIWAALGIMLVTAISVLFSKEPINGASILGIIAITIGVTLVSMFGPSH